MKTQPTQALMRALPRERTIVPCQAETSFRLRQRCRRPEVLLRSCRSSERRLPWRELAASWPVDCDTGVDHIRHLISTKAAYPAADPGQRRLLPGCHVCANLIIVARPYERGGIVDVRTVD